MLNLSFFLGVVFGALVVPLMVALIAGVISDRAERRLGRSRLGRIGIKLDAGRRR
jgi:hypothetical protein